MHTVDDADLAERQRRGLDKKDELWDGVVHMVPPPSGLHELVSHDLLFALKPIVDRLGLVIRGGTTGLFASALDYRVPDISIARPEHLSARGLEAAELVIEVLSPNDESRDKLPFYAARGVREVWLVDPVARSVEMFALDRDRYVPMPNALSRVLGIDATSLFLAV